MNRKHFLRILSAALLPALLSACAAQRPELYAMRNGGSHQPFYFTDRYGELAFREFYDWAGQFVGDRAVVERDGKELSLDMLPQVDSQSQRATLGIMPVITKQSHGFFESAGMAVQRTGQLCQRMLVGIYEMITGETKADLAGPIGVAQLAGQVASVGFVNLLVFTAFLSINLGILNLLPIPLLDGGYIILLILEGISGRRMPTKALQSLPATCMVLL